jgi:chemotaxis protein CheD
MCKADLLVAKSTDATIPSIRMGEMSVARNGVKLRTLLGSCIGLALYDQRGKVGGLAHIVLPRANGPTDRPGKFVDTAVPALIAEVRKISRGEPMLTAKIAGGASMFSTTQSGNIGLQNLESCERLLGELGIPIVGRHCGGSQGRRMSLNTDDGVVVIEVVGEDPIEL